MTNEQLTEVKATFKRLEGILLQASSVESIFTDESGFTEVFEKARECLRDLDLEPVVECRPGEFDSRDKIREVIEAIEIIQGYVNNGIKPQDRDSLLARLKATKAILTDVNQVINNK